MKDEPVKRFITIIERLIIRIESNPSGEPWRWTAGEEEELLNACSELHINPPPLSKYVGDGHVLWVVVDPNASTVTISVNGKAQVIPRGITMHPILISSVERGYVTFTDETGEARRRAIQALRLWKHFAETKIGEGNGASGPRNQKQLASDLGVSESTIRNWAKAAGVPARESHGDDYTAAEVSRIIQWGAEHGSIKTGKECRRIVESKAAK